MSIFCKVHDEKILACADEDLIGRTFSEGELEIKISEIFYKDFKVDEKKLVKLLKGFDNINLIGKKVVGIAIKENLVNKEKIKKIDGKPMAIICRV